ncbi:MAG: hypothetical protein HRU76_04015 [Phycisphaeraceae bacterium]|nr:hypothetical protein [Phycisphaerales bacterium]QOJ16800.1 MAG: hypothetical protein HRU76_04015 [Phycisphaeraceae bacterium]
MHLAQRINRLEHRGRIIAFGPHSGCAACGRHGGRLAIEFGVWGEAAPAASTRPTHCPRCGRRLVLELTFDPRD